MARSWCPLRLRPTRTKTLRKGFQISRSNIGRKALGRPVLSFRLTASTAWIRDEPASSTRSRGSRFCTSPARARRRSGRNQAEKQKEPEQARPPFRLYNYIIAHFGGIWARFRNSILCLTTVGCVDFGTYVGLDKVLAPKWEGRNSGRPPPKSRSLHSD
jgi:hypothetical protein